MSDTIDILVVIDCDAILAATPDPSQNPKAPTAVNAELVSMLTTQSQVVSGQGTAELDVSAVEGDVVRWRARSLSSNTDHSVLLTDFHQTHKKLPGQGLVTQIQVVGAVSDGTPPMSVQQPFPQTPASDGPAWISVPTFWFQTTVLEPGSIRYVWTFALYDQDNALLGYFKWDPRITATGEPTG